MVSATEEVDFMIQVVKTNNVGECERLLAQNSNLVDVIDLSDDVSKCTDLAFFSHKQMQPPEQKYCSDVRL
jgi:ankyrin repeat protein